MRALLVLIGFAVNTSGVSAESMHVDGVVVNGALNALSVADLHEAIIATTSESVLGKPNALDVVDRSEVHVYYELRDLGWFPFRHVMVVQPDGRRRLEWLQVGRVVWDMPEAMSLIATADEVYVFPLTTPLKPHRDDGHLRLLVGEARQRIMRLLGNEKSWFHGLIDLIEIGVHIFLADIQRVGRQVKGKDLRLARGVVHDDDRGDAGRIPLKIFVEKHFRRVVHDKILRRVLPDRLKERSRVYHRIPQGPSGRGF